VNDKPHPAGTKATENERRWNEWADEHGVCITTASNPDCTAHHEVFRRDSDGKIVAVPVPCKRRYCPHCQDWREHARRAKTEKRVMQMEKSRGKARLKFLTLTIRNTGDIDEECALLHRAMRNMIRSAWGKENIQRGCWVIEWTKNPGTPPHIHIHAVIQTDKLYIPWGQLRTAWRRALQADYEPFVNITALKGKWSTVAAYMSKYMNADAFTHPLWAELSEAFKGKQLMGVWGKFTGDREDDSTYTRIGTTLQWIPVVKYWSGQPHRVHLAVVHPLSEFLKGVSE